MYIILDNKKKMEKAKSLLKKFYGVPLNAFYPLLEFRTKPDLKKLNLERLADSGDELHNVAGNTAYCLFVVYLTTLFSVSQTI
jgi:hypothetical protein